MPKVRFEWDEKKSKENEAKHAVSFELAQYVFADPNRVIAEDLGHSNEEKRYYCFGSVEGGDYDGSLHLSRECDPHLWCWVLAKREENL